MQCGYGASAKGWERIQAKAWVGQNLKQRGITDGWPRLRPEGWYGYDLKDHGHHLKCLARCLG